MRALLPLGALLLTAAAPPLRFAPVEARHAGAAAEYRRIWCSEGARMIAVLERVSGATFPANSIELFVGDGPPMTNYDGRTIWLKASYPTYYKQATLVHELGHRLSFTLRRTPDLDDHRLLDLFLYDVWSDLYGQAYAERMVGIERQIRGRYDYAAAWGWALSMTREQRQARLTALRTTGVAAPQQDPATMPPGCSTATPTRSP